MAYLQDARNASRLAELAPDGVRLLSAARSRFLRRTKAQRVSGHLGDIAGRPAAVYVAGGKLWLAIDRQPWPFDEVTAGVHRSDPSTGDVLVHIRTPAEQYEFRVDDSTIENDSTAFADVEDFCFGLWVARILDDGARQDVLLEVLVDAPLDEVPQRVGGDVTAMPPIAWSASSAAADQHNGRKRRTQ